MTFTKVMIVALACVTISESVPAQSYLRSWGIQVFDTRWNEEAFVQISAGGDVTAMLRSNGSVSIR